MLTPASVVRDVPHRCCLIGWQHCLVLHQRHWHLPARAHIVLQAAWSLNVPQHPRHGCRWPFGKWVTCNIPAATSCTKLLVMADAMEVLPFPWIRMRSCMHAEEGGCIGIRGRWHSNGLSASTSQLSSICATNKCFQRLRSKK